MFLSKAKISWFSSFVACYVLGAWWYLSLLPWCATSECMQLLDLIHQFLGKTRILWSCCNTEDVIQHKNWHKKILAFNNWNVIYDVLHWQCNGISGLLLLVEQDFSTEGITYSSVSGGFLPSQKTQFSFLAGVVLVFFPHKHYQMLNPVKHSVIDLKLDL